MRAIVLGGGGARGAYEVGVWKGLRKLNIKYDIVTGTSIGAINGMFMVQKQFYRCLSLWRKVSFDGLFDDFNEGNSVGDIYKEFLSKTIKGGIDTSKFERLLDNYYDKKKFYASSIKYGIKTYNVSLKKEVEVTKENTRPDQLVSYIAASGACFPVFKPKTIKENLYIDGGYFDNLPINLAIKLKATEIIAVDLDTIGVIKKVKDKNVKIKYIRPSSKLDSFFMFEKNRVHKMIEIGYYDCLKAFDKLEGRVYTFKLGTLKYLSRKYFNKFNDNLSKCDLKKVNEKDFFILIEKMMEVFKLRLNRIYNYREVNEKILSRFKGTDALKIDSLDKVSSFFKKDILVRTIYDKIISEKFIASFLYQDEIMMAIYILTIRRKI